MAKILVAEDNKGMRQLLAAILSMEGYDVVEAEDGEVAIEKLRTESFDLLITDYSMPEADGLEVIDEAASPHLGLPVILISGTLPSEVRRRADGLVNYILEKPFGAAKLLGAVSVLLK